MDKNKGGLFSMKVEHAVIMAAGTSSRLAPLSCERPKALLEVKGDILIERQIRQLISAGIRRIVVVTGYKAGMFQYLRDKYGVTLVHNDEYGTRNNNGSLCAARAYLQNAYVCSADNYFAVNPFETAVDHAFYAVLYADGETNEWCVSTNEQGIITNVEIGGRDSWYMLGHVFFDQAFADAFLRILLANYHDDAYRHLLWEDIYRRHLTELKMKAKAYPDDTIFEFDTLDELRAFDPTYKKDARSAILRDAAAKFGCRECDITGTAPVAGKTGEVIGFSFRLHGNTHEYLYPTSPSAAEKSAL